MDRLEYMDRVMRSTRLRQALCAGPNIWHVFFLLTKLCWEDDQKSALRKHVEAECMLPNGTLCRALNHLIKSGLVAKYRTREGTNAKYTVRYRLTLNTSAPR